jgi:hypothetical protein
MDIGITNRTREHPWAWQKNHLSHFGACNADNRYEDLLE